MKTYKMKVRVKLFGTLGHLFPGYQLAHGMDVDIPDGARTRDLLVHLKIPKSQNAVVSMDERIMKPDDKLQSGATVHVFQAVFGG